MKSDSDRDLIIAVEALGNHQPFFTPQVTEAILGRSNTGEPERLTARER
jgi:hypothetical protein